MTLLRGVRAACRAGCLRAGALAGLAALAGLLAVLPAAPAAADTGLADGGDADTGMTGWTDREIGEALDAFVPRLMAAHDVPGVQVAVLRGARLIHERGYGVRNVLTGKPVTRETLFEAASLSKPVAAYAALQLVAEGTLSLDEDLGARLDTPWLEPDASGRPPRVTLRHILTHMSGLGNNIRRDDRSLDGAPGAAFAYSGEGFGYLGHVLEAERRAPFPDIVAQQVLWPLGLTEMGFALDAAGLARMASGHVHLWIPLALVFVPFVAVAAATLLLLWLYFRLVRGEMRLPVEHLFLPVGLGIAAALITVLEVVGLGLAVTTLLVALLALLVMALLTVLWRLVFHLAGLTTAPPGTVVRHREARRAFWRRAAVVLGALCLVPLLTVNLPLPLRAGDDYHPAVSLRANAAGLAVFARELMAPQLLPAELVAEMTRPQVAVGPEAPGMYWGLGIGIRDRRLADGRVQRTLWQWGANPGYQSLMVISPADDMALVVLTNAQSGGPLVQALAAHMFGGLGDVRGGGGWRLPASAMGDAF